jgi:hypothetical protein
MNLTLHTLISSSAISKSSIPTPFTSIFMRDIKTPYLTWTSLIASLTNESQTDSMTHTTSTYELSIRCSRVISEIYM